MISYVDIGGSLNNICVFLFRIYFTMSVGSCKICKKKLQIHPSSRDSGVCRHVGMFNYFPLLLLITFLIINGVLLFLFK